MKRFIITLLFGALLAGSWIMASQAPSGAATSGQGKMKFRVLYTSAHLPAEARKC